MSREFIVYGEPVGKGRPKFTTISGFTKTYTPEKTVSFENLVKLSYQEAFGNEKPFDKDEQLEVRITAFFQIPKSASKKKAAQMLSGFIKPTKRPDLDNVAKAVLDALNKIAFYDDSQIIALSMSKFYSDKPRTEISIRSDELWKKI